MSVLSKRLAAGLAALCCALVVCLPAPGRAAVDVVSETNGQIVLQVTRDPGVLAPVDRAYVAIAAQGSYSVSLTATRYTAIAGSPDSLGGVPVDSLRARSAALDTLRVGSPFPYRGVRILYLEIATYIFPPGGQAAVLAGARVTVNYTPAPKVIDRASADPLVRALAVNRNVFPAPGDGAAGDDPWFSLSPNWVRVTVPSRGLYTITYQDLQNAGVSPQSIQDPSTLRLYGLLGVEQPRDYADPSGTWRDGPPMRQVAILVDTGGDGTFGPGDRIVFYGLGAEDWSDYYDPQAPDTTYYRNPRAKQNVYFLTWDGMLPGSAARVTGVAGAPQAGGELTTTVKRVYQERDRINDFDFRGDGWLWVQIPAVGIKRATLSTIDVNDLVASQPQVFRTLALAPYTSTGGSIANEHWMRYEVVHGSVVAVGEKKWTAGSHDDWYDKGKPVRIEGNFLAEGANTFRIEVPPSPPNPNAADAQYFAWYSVAYQRRMIATGDACSFTSPDTSAAVTFHLRGFSGSGSPYVFDVTNPTAPLRITGVEYSAGDFRFTESIGGRRRHLWAATTAGLRKPALQKIQPRELRTVDTRPNMLIIVPEAFQSAAQRLAAYRQSHLPGYAGGHVEVASTRDIFDNFSGGLSDPMGIRNFIKFVYDHSIDDATGNHTLAYVVLFGDATNDYRNNASQAVDWVPTNLYFTENTSFVFATDEWYGHMDPADQVPGRAVLDLAIGRLPAATRTEADQVVTKIIDYETASTFGSWRDQVVLVADDEHSSSAYACDIEFVTDSELMAATRIANFVDVRKVYLTEYPFVSTVKPGSRRALLDYWNEGALLINFIGHGSSQQMADEQVFLSNDVALLNNGLRLPMLMAFSCTIGDFGNAQTKSMSEKLLIDPAGGAIATLTASNETFSGSNKRLNYAAFYELTPRRLGEEEPAIGVAVTHAKLQSLIDGFNSVPQEENDWKYNLLGDPALRLRVPDQEIHILATAPDTMVAGVRKTISGAVYRDGAVDASFNGSVRVVVREPDYMRAYTADCEFVNPPPTIYYLYPAGTIFDGTADVTAGTFHVNFRVPRYPRRGPLAHLTAYANDETRDAATTEDSLLVLVDPTAADSLALRPRDGAPRVKFGFKSGLQTVKPGETLQALVHDADGIDILETTNAGTQAILFDDVPLPIKVNDYFSFAHGGSDTSGVLLYPLPNLAFGRHQAVYKVSDAFGQTTLDTLVFHVTDPQDYSAQVLFNYPNPFRTTTQFLVRLSDPAHIRLDVFTVSGRRVRRIEAFRDAGDVWIPWDGRDEHGGDLANGVYLYVATVAFEGLDRPPLVIRGKLSKIE